MCCFKFTDLKESNNNNNNNSAGKTWCEIRRLHQKCETCLRFKRPPPRPVTGLPLASTFQECVGMDLKFYKGNILLHLVDHATRLSASTIISSKKPEEIIRGIFQNWISVYGTPGKFLTDNGGEFANHHFLSMCEGFNITVHTTAAESPWSNGLVERHNRTIAEMLDKMLSDTPCDMHIALAWCISAKNSLQNCHGFSPYQLAIGHNPTLPCAYSDRPPALNHEASTLLIKKNLDALHNAREAFIKSENSDRIRRALSHNVRTTSDAVYTT